MKHPVSIDRRKTLKTLSALAFCQLIGSSVRASGEFPSAEDARRNAFPTADSFKKRREIAKGEQFETIKAKSNGSARSRIFTFYEARRGGRLLGYTVEGATLGKHMDIDYMVALGPDLAVTHLEILAYRESYGYQIRGERFRRQFYGTQSGDSLRLGDEIQNIATATISCRSMIRAVTEVLAYASVLIGPADDDRAETTPPGDKANSRHCLHRTIPVMGTLLEVTAWRGREGDSVAAEMPTHKDASCTDLDNAVRAAMTEVRRIERLLSRFDPNSDIARLNAGGPGEFTALSPETCDLLARCERYRIATNGAFDVRVSGTIDLGGIAKGYALDRAATVLRERGVSRALLNFGGHILALDPPPGETAWRITIKATGETVALRNASLATSSDTERGGHILGRDGRAARRRSAVSVRATTAEHADVLSTAAFLGIALDEATLIA